MCTVLVVVVSKYMDIRRKSEPYVLLLGDLFFFIISLWLTLSIRYSEIPTSDDFYNHLAPFSLLFAVWLLVFFIAGLYDRHTALFEKELPTLIIQAQFVNIIIAALFFFLIPSFGIAPKTNLFIYLIVSSVFIIFWRLVLEQFLPTHRNDSVVLVGSGDEFNELAEELSENKRYGFSKVSYVKYKTGDNPNDVQNKVLESVTRDNASSIIVNVRGEGSDLLLPLLYNLSFLNQRLQILDVVQVYETVFSRIPISLVHYDWLIEHAYSGTGAVYRALKRTMDFVIASIALVLSLPFQLFAVIAIKLDDGGHVFIVQERVGENGRVIRVRKFRSMQRNEDGVWIGESDNKITRVGGFLRKSRIDELPQLWNVILGDLSLIGPRPDMVGLRDRLSEKIPYYNVRYMVKPGLSGWAQIRQEYDNKNISPQSISDSKTRLEYDVYYIKNNSVILDLEIALRTLKVLVSGLGS